MTNSFDNNQSSADRELQDALAAQRAHLAAMSTQFSADNMNVFHQINERVRRAQIAVNTQTTAPNNYTTAQRATVRLIRAGKDEKVLDVNGGMTLRQVIEQAGWDPGSMTVQKRTGGGGSQDANLDAPVGEGTFEFLCNPKYAAGIRC